jgi:hypothetical protein
MFSPKLTAVRSQRAYCVMYANAPAWEGVKTPEDIALLPRERQGWLTAAVRAGAYANHSFHAGIIATARYLIRMVELLPSCDIYQVSLDLDKLLLKLPQCTFQSEESSHRPLTPLHWAPAAGCRARARVRRPPDDEYQRRRRCRRATAAGDEPAPRAVGHGVQSPALDRSPARAGRRGRRVGRGEWWRGGADGRTCRSSRTGLRAWMGGWRATWAWRTGCQGRDSLGCLCVFCRFVCTHDRVNATATARTVPISIDSSIAEPPLAPNLPHPFVAPEIWSI